ncbi:MAG: protocatechuate 3,4-dioxygenase subunit beta [Pseudomonadota bacterium]
MTSRVQGYLPRDAGVQPPALAPAYRSSVLRAPRLPPLAIEATPSELSGPVFGHQPLDPLDHDLLQNGRVTGDPIGERIVVHGTVRDQGGRPVRGALIELWQANAGGRYRHVNDDYLAALDPNFLGYGRCLTDGEGAFRFRTVRPGPYPWRNGPNDWRPAHIHLSLFGDAFAQRLVTQMYFEGDPLIARCPIVQAIPDPRAIERLTAKLDWSASTPFDCLAYRFDVVLRGADQTHFETRPEGV